MDKISTLCSHCSGTGIETVSSMVDGETIYSEITCRFCEGSGLNSNLSLSGDLITLLNDMFDKINDIMEKCNDIFEKVNE